MTHIDVSVFDDTQRNAALAVSGIRSLHALSSCDSIYHMDAKTLEKMRLLIARLPKGSDFRADDALSREFFELSEDSTNPDVLRDFCLDLSLRADAIETGPLGIADSAALLAELEKRAILAKR